MHNQANARSTQSVNKPAVRACVRSSCTNLGMSNESPTPWVTAEIWPTCRIRDATATWWLRKVPFAGAAVVAYEVYDALSCY